MMTVHPYQADPKFNHNHSTCRSCIKLPLDVDGIYANIDNQILKPPRDILVHLEALENGRKADIGTINK